MRIPWLAASVCAVLVLVGAGACVAVPPHDPAVGTQPDQVQRRAVSAAMAADVASLNTSDAAP